MVAHVWPALLLPTKLLLQIHEKLAKSGIRVTLELGLLVLPYCK